MKKQLQPNTRITTTVTRHDTYQLTPVVELEMQYAGSTTNKHLHTSLSYTGKKLIFGKEKTVEPILFKPSIHAWLRSHHPWQDDLDDVLIDVEKITDPNAVNPRDIYFLSYYDHTIYGINEEIVPIPIYADYMTGSFDSNNYDLGKLRSLLLKNKEVHDVSALQRVPFYNQDDTGTRMYITFTILPDTKKLRELAKAVKDDSRLKDIVCGVNYRMQGVPKKYRDYLGIASARRISIE